MFDCYLIDISKQERSISIFEHFMTKFYGTALVCVDSIRVMFLSDRDFHKYIHVRYMNCRKQGNRHKSPFLLEILKLKKANLRK